MPTTDEMVAAVGFVYSVNQYMLYHYWYSPFDDNLFESNEDVALEAIEDGESPSGWATAFAQRYDLDAAPDYELKIQHGGLTFEDWKLKRGLA
jgi:hypothetical protein